MSTEWVAVVDIRQGMALAPQRFQLQQMCVAEKTGMVGDQWSQSKAGFMGWVMRLCGMGVLDPEGCRRVRSSLFFATALGLVGLSSSKPNSETGVARSRAAVNKKWRMTMLSVDPGEWRTSQVVGCLSQAHLGRLKQHLCKCILVNGYERWMNGPKVDGLLGGRGGFKTFR